MQRVSRAAKNITLPEIASSGGASAGIPAGWSGRYPGPGWDVGGASGNERTPGDGVHFRPSERGHGSQPCRVEVLGTVLSPSPQAWPASRRMNGSWVWRWWTSGRNDGHDCLQRGRRAPLAVIPVGGEHFTNDIAVGLRTPIPEAEKMKKAWVRGTFPSAPTPWWRCPEWGKDLPAW